MKKWMLVNRFGLLSVYLSRISWKELHRTIWNGRGCVIGEIIWEIRRERNTKNNVNLEFRWRLKRLRHSQLRHSHEDIYYGNDSEDEEDDSDICYCDECVNVGLCSILWIGYLCCKHAIVHLFCCFAESNSPNWTDNLFMAAIIYLLHVFFVCFRVTLTCAEAIQTMASIPTVVRRRIPANRCWWVFAPWRKRHNPNRWPKFWRDFVNSTIYIWPSSKKTLSWR